MNSIRRKAILTLFTGALAAFGRGGGPEGAAQGRHSGTRLAKPAMQQAKVEMYDWLSNEPEVVPRVQRTGLPGLPLCPF